MLMKFIIWRAQLRRFITKKSNKDRKNLCIGVINILGLAKKHNINIQTSTSEVYGDPEIHPQTKIILAV